MPIDIGAHYTSSLLQGGCTRTYMRGMFVLMKPQVHIVESAKIGICFAGWNTCTQCQQDHHYAAISGFTWHYA